MYARRKRWSGRCAAPRALEIEINESSHCKEQATMKASSFIKRGTVTIKRGTLNNYVRGILVACLLLACGGLYAVNSRITIVEAQSPPTPSMPGRILNNLVDANNGAIGAYNTDGTNPISLTTLKFGSFFLHPSQSKQTGMIAFAGCGDFNTPVPCGSYGSQTRIFVMNGDGTNIRQITSTPDLTTGDDQSDTVPVISPDGTKVAFISGRANYPLDANGQKLGEEVYVVNVDGTNLHQVSAKQTSLADINGRLVGSKAYNVAWSPDSSRVVARCDRKYRRAGSDVNNKEFLADKDTLEGMLRIFSVDAANDGTLVAISVLPYQDTDPYHGANFSQKADRDKAISNYTTDGYPRIGGLFGEVLDWSPTGDTIIASIVTVNRFGGGFLNQGVVYYGVFNPSGGLRTTLSSQALIGGATTGDYNGDTTRELCYQTPGCARISPDGQQLVYGSYNANANPTTEIRIANIDGSNAHTIGTSSTLGGYRDAKWWSAGAPIPTPARLALTPNPVTIYVNSSGQPGPGVQLTPTLSDAQGNAIVRAASYGGSNYASPGTGFICDAQHPCTGNYVGSSLNVDVTGKVTLKPGADVGSGGTTNLCAENAGLIGCTVINVSFPTVGVTATVPTTRKSGAGAAGKFTIRTTGAAGSTLVANFTLGGTAVRDVDYTLNVSGNSVTIPAGQSSYDIIVTPNPASSNRGDKTVVLTLSPDTTNTFTLDSAAASATVTIQDDNAPPATQLSLSSIAPNKGGDMGSVTANIYGANIKPGATVKLARSGQADITGTNVSVAPNNLFITATFDLTNKQQGAWDVVVTNPDHTTATLNGGFTIIPGIVAKVTLSLIGRFSALREVYIPRYATKSSNVHAQDVISRAGRAQTFFLAYGNTGNADAPATDLRLSIPRVLDVTAPPVSPNGTPAVRIDNGGDYINYEISLSKIPAGTSGSIPFQLIPKEVHTDYQMFAYATSSRELQPIVDQPIDPTATFSADYTANTSDSLKLTMHVNRASGRTDIPIQMTRTQTTEAKEPTINITENNGILTIKYEATVPGTDASSSNVNSVRSAGIQIAGRESANAAGTNDTRPLGGPQELLSAVAVLPGRINPNGTVNANYLSSVNNAISTYNASAAAGERQQLTAYLQSHGFLNDDEANSLNNLANGAVVINAANTVINAPGTPVNAVAGAQFGALTTVMNGAWELRVWQLYRTDADFNLRYTDENGNHLTRDELIARLKKEAYNAQQVKAEVKGKTLEPGDPNALIGTDGGGDRGYVDGTEPLNYAVYFENKPDASAAAQDVIITNQLDPSRYDLSTFSLGVIGFGKTIVTPPAGLSHYTTDVDLRPSNNLIVRIEAALDRTTGQLTWRFTSLDPATMQPTNDPTAGFLPPNRTSPEGQGTVAFNVMPKTGLTTGTEIYTKSRIVFDTNAPIDTNFWLNTIDNTNPVSRVTALDTSQPSIVFNVKWSGTDTGAGIDTYTIYVSENGGAFTIWRDGTTDTSGLFAGQPGKTYSFYSVARDKANNAEAAKTVAEATTSVASSSLQNSIDDPRFFVRQQYLDFLNREPDTGGFDYWTGLITSCPSGDAKCINSKRVTVSAAFFIEQEFQDTGSFVYRFYKGSLGRPPAYDEFVSDRSRVIGGTALEASKVAFAETWTQRPEFLDKYPATLSSAQFVDALLQTVKQTSTVDLTSQRQTFVNQLQATGGTRGQVIRAVIDTQAFQKAEYNRAFVLMQYFGYLRRDPDTAGYQFWLDILNNRVANNYRSMVCAFITSAEYQLRFGSAVTRTDAVCGSIGQ